MQKCKNREIKKSKSRKIEKYRNREIDNTKLQQSKINSNSRNIKKKYTA